MNIPMTFSLLASVIKTIKATITMSINVAIQCYGNIVSKLTFATNQVLSISATLLSGRFVLISEVDPNAFSTLDSQTLRNIEFISS